MQKLQQFKTQHLSKFSQLILLNREGHVVASCDSIFSTINLRDKPASNLFPFIESIFDSLLNIEVDHPEVRFSKVETHLDILPGSYDYTFTSVELDGENYILWSIYDYTDLYEDFKQFQQKRNELEIHRQKLEERNKKLKHQTDILAQKNLLLENINTIQNDYFGRIKNALQSPVNALDGLTFILSQKKNAGDNDYISALRATAEHLQSVIAEFEGMSAQDTSMDLLEGEVTEFNLQSLIESVIKLFRENIGDTVKIDIDYAADVPTILFGNPLNLKRVIYSLLLNSHKNDQYSKLGIALSTAEKKDSNYKLQLDIREHLLPESSNGETPLNITELVLRLSVVKKMIELQGGSIAVSSDPVKKNITISCQIPLSLPNSVATNQ